MTSKNDQPAQTSPLPGYPLMEELIQTENFGEIKETMGNAYKLLEDMLENNTGGLNKQKQIKQVLNAYDLTFGMIKYLLDTKKDMIEKTENPSKG